MDYKSLTERIRVFLATVNSRKITIPQAAEEIAIIVKDEEKQAK